MPDSFKKLCELTKPDPRSEMWCIFDPDTKNSRDIKIEDVYLQLKRLELHKGVPEKVRIHFDTTRNLYLYSWFVYRFTSVAEWHASATLEFALKIKAGGKKEGLRKLIKHAIDHGWIRNEKFTVWQREKQIYEYHKSTMEQLSKEIASDTNQVQDDEFHYEYLNVLEELIPAIRNMYAHGSNMFGIGPFGHLITVSEFINQLFDE